MTIWLAPLHGITYYNFRNTLVSHFGGIDAAVTPFLPVQSAEKLNVKKWKDVFVENNKLLPVIPQLMGNIAGDFVDTAKALHDTYGYSRFNWNIGCPVAQVVKRKRGCGVMPDVTLVEKVVTVMNKQMTFQFSVKMRLGLYDVSEGINIIKMLNNYPLDFIAIHPRLGVQQYEGHPDLEAFSTFLSLSRHRIIYSGDINNADGLVKMQRLFPQVDDWMLGRGLLCNPLLAEQIKGQYHDKANDLLRFIAFYHELENSLSSFRNEKGVLANMKEFWHYFSSFFVLPAAQLLQLLRTDSLLSFNQQVEEIFEKKLS